MASLTSHLSVGLRPVKMPIYWTTTTRQKERLLNPAAPDFPLRAIISMQIKKLLLTDGKKMMFGFHSFEIINLPSNFFTFLCASIMKVQMFIFIYPILRLEKIYNSGLIW